jgi:hypothetical protein
MTEHRKDVVKSFCEYCRVIIEEWTLRRLLFDDNKEIHILENNDYTLVFRVLDRITQESCLQNMAKLHDPAKKGKYKNLSIDYLIENIDWNASIKTNLVSLKNRMLTVSTPIGEARNKLLAHNDLLTYLNNDAPGKFEKDKDKEYFDCLYEFADIASRTILGEPFAGEPIIESDVMCLLDCLKMGIAAKASQDNSI